MVAVEKPKFSNGWSYANISLFHEIVSDQDLGQIGALFQGKYSEFQNDTNNATHLKNNQSPCWTLKNTRQAMATAHQLFWSCRELITATQILLAHPS